MSLGPWEIALIFIVIIILFGGKKLPELARGLGLGLKEFKKAKDGITEQVENITDEVNEDSNK
tara:strand:- start:276 stop:464 length:189 start_codon:yes stop_codon:yes gene_type:complete